MKKYQVYEHRYLQIDTNDTQLTNHLSKLQNEVRKSIRTQRNKQLNEQLSNVYTVIGTNYVKFHQYVGAIQAGRITIEILPKIDYEDDIYSNHYQEVNSNIEKKDKEKWHSVLIEMLKVCKYLKFKHSRNAFLDTNPGTLLDLMYFEFMHECELLLRSGLVKKYIPVEKNRKYLKGKIIFSKHVTKNHIHQERFYTRQNEYSQNNTFNQILYTALKCITNSNAGSEVRSKANQLLFEFPEVSLLKKTDGVFEKLIYDRKTEVYRDANIWAELILNQLLPNLHHGGNKVVALVFDMNKLWEEYLYQILRKVMENGDTLSKPTINFWESKVGDKQIKPDILFERNKSKIVLDAKWKIPKKGNPSSADMMQLLAYCAVTGAENSYLVFPLKDSDQTSSTKIQRTDGTFKVNQIFSNKVFNGGYIRVSVLNLYGKLNNDLGTELLGALQVEQTQ